MKTTKEKRADLVRLISGKKTLAEISLESVSNLRIRGNVNAPEYWIGSLKVDESKFAQCFDWLEQHSPSVIIDWSTKDKLNIIIPVSIRKTDFERGNHEI